MAYRPPVKKSTYDGPSGLAKVFLNGNRTKAKVVFPATASTEQKEYIVSVSNCPKEVQDYIRSGEFITRMNQEGDKIFSMHPANGMFEFKVAKFSSKKDQPPAPITKVGQNQAGQTYSYLFFVVMLEIVAGEYKGMQVPLYPRYDFCEEKQEIKGEMKSVVGYSKSLEKSKHAAFLDEFLTITGVWNYGPIPYSDNILPKLEQRMLRAKKHFSGIVKKGYVETLYEQSSLPTQTKLPDEPEFTDGAEFDAENLTDDPVVTDEKFE